MKNVATCHFCKQITDAPIQITKMNPDGSLSNYEMCVACSKKHITVQTQDETVKSLAISHIKSPEDLLDFLTSKKQEDNVCDCGMSSQEFSINGKFGCPNCYRHFQNEMVKMVFPYHGGDHHVGKRPKTLFKKQFETSHEEQLKLLKLQMAKAIELEQYERAAEIKQELAKLLNQQSASISEDQ